MSYIYDILLNFQKEYYDFYEWNPNDKIIHVRKIPLFLIDKRDLTILKNSLVQFSKEFCEKIFNRTEIFKKININLLNYVFLVSDGQCTIALKLNKNGFVSHKSSLLLDEEEDVSEVAADLNRSELSYKIIKKNSLSFITRSEHDEIDRLLKLLTSLYNHKEDEKLRFLYFECFEKKEKDINIAFQRLKQEILADNNNKKKIKDFFNLISQNEQTNKANS